MYIISCQYFLHTEIDIDLNDLPNWLFLPLYILLIGIKPVTESQKNGVYPILQEIKNEQALK